MHVHPALAAAAKKLDIYCEKPLTQNIAEGRLLVNAVQKHDLIFQTGSQQRSEFGNRFRTAVEMIWAGRIGKLKTIRIGVGAPAVPCDLPAEEKPDNVAWDLWLGPAPMRAYNEILATPLAESDRRVPASDNHLRNWLDCVKSRQQPICTAETGHRSASVCHLANIGYRLRRKLEWDPVKEQFVNDTEANTLTSREPRKGWEYA